MPVAKCEDCGTVLLGRWCHACGQDSRSPLRHFPMLAEDFFNSVFGWDSRLMRSLRVLFGTPGQLTAEFVAGRRTRFLGPLRLYLIASLLFFACFTLTPDPVLATIAGLGDWRTGLFRIEYVSRWMPTMMILVLPGFALILQLLYRRPPRPFLEHMVFVLHFGSFSFLMLPIAQLVAWSLHAAGAPMQMNWPLLIGHGINAWYFFASTRRYYGLGVAASAVRVLAFCLLLTVMLGGFAQLVHLFIVKVLAPLFGATPLPPP